MSKTRNLRKSVLQKSFTKRFHKPHYREIRTFAPSIFIQHFFNFTQVKKEKKPKIDRSNPNWKLKSRPDIKVWKDDPLFQTNEDVPFVSSLSHSHMITRAVMMNDMKLLKKCIDDRKVISRINPRRSLAVPLGNNFKYILSNKYALKLFFTDFVSDFQSDFEFDFKSDFRIQFSNYNIEFQF